MLIRLNTDQVRVVGLWGWADTVPGRHRAGPTQAGPTRVADAGNSV